MGNADSTARVAYNLVAEEMRNRARIYQPDEPLTPGHYLVSADLCADTISALTRLLAVIPENRAPALTSMLDQWRQQTSNHGRHVAADRALDRFDAAYCRAFRAGGDEGEHWEAQREAMYEALFGPFPVERPVGEIVPFPDPDPDSEIPF